MATVSLHRRPGVPIQIGLFSQQHLAVFRQVFPGLGHVQELGALSGILSASRELAALFGMMSIFTGLLHASAPHTGL